MERGRDKRDNTRGFSCSVKKQGSVCDTDPVWPRELRLLDLEIEESGQGDGIEKPGSETNKNNNNVRQTYCFFF